MVEFDQIFVKHEVKHDEEQVQELENLEHDLNLKHDVNLEENLEENVEEHNFMQEAQHQPKQEYENEAVVGGGEKKWPGKNVF